MRDRCGRQQPKLSSPDERADTNALTFSILGFLGRPTQTQPTAPNGIPPIYGHFGERPSLHRITTLDRKKWLFKEHSLTGDKTPAETHSAEGAILALTLLYRSLGCASLGNHSSPKGRDRSTVGKQGSRNR